MTEKNEPGNQLPDWFPEGIAQPDNPITVVEQSDQHVLYRRDNGLAFHVTLMADGSTMHEAAIRRLTSQQVINLHGSLAHGDADHSAWLLNAISAWASYGPIPPPIGSGNKEARIAELETQLKALEDEREQWLGLRIELERTNKELAAELDKLRAAPLQTWGDKVASDDVAHAEIRTDADREPVKLTAADVAVVSAEDLIGSR